MMGNLERLHENTIDENNPNVQEVLSELSGLGKWISLAYLLDPDPVSFYRATHKIKANEPPRLIIATANAWVNSQKMKDYLLYLKDKVQRNPSFSFSLEDKAREIQEKSKELESSMNAEPLTRDELIGWLSSILRNPNIPDDEKVIFGKELAKLEKWSDDDSASEEETIYDKLTHFYIPFECDKCERYKVDGICTGCSIFREDIEDLTPEEMQWVEENDKIKEGGKEDGTDID